MIKLKNFHFSIILFLTRNFIIIVINFKKLFKKNYLYLKID